MSFIRVLQLMIVYYILAVGFNVVSLILIKMGSAPLIQGSPVASIILLSLYLVLAYAGSKHWRWVFIGIGVFGLLALPTRGIFPHVLALFEPERLSVYASETVVWVALSINCFGFVVLALSFYCAPFLKKVKET